jgi:hypothetical protein
MLEHLSPKFRTPPQQALREPRAALILNRFTRTLTVMYATNAISSILGVSPDQFKDKSFYECIQENCIPDAIRCLESAKANDSIAYLRFWYRDPRRPEDVAEEQEAIHDATQSSDSEEGGVELHDHGQMDVDTEPPAEGSFNPVTRDQAPSYHRGENASGQETSGDDQAVHSASSNSIRQTNTSSQDSTDEHQSAGAMFDQASRSSTSSVLVTPEQRRQARTAPAVERRAVTSVPAVEPYEIEAVVSCTSDGLVVVLRRARPIVPDFQPPVAAAQLANGLFAAPWGENPIRPHVHQPNPQNPLQHDLEAPLAPSGGPPLDDFMNSIREVAVFAWSLAGINGNIASYGRGVPRDEAQPPDGLPVWDPYAHPAPEYVPPENQAAANWAQRDVKMGNSPIEGNEIQMGWDRHRLMPHPYLNDGGYVFQGPGNYVNNGYENAFGQIQSAAEWAAGPPSNNPNLPPTTREGARGNYHRQ